MRRRYQTELDGGNFPMPGMRMSIFRCASRLVMCGPTAAEWKARLACVVGIQRTQVILDTSCLNVLESATSDCPSFLALSVCGPDQSVAARNKKLLNECLLTVRVLRTSPTLVVRATTVLLAPHTLRLQTQHQPWKYT